MRNVKFAAFSILAFSIFVVPTKAFPSFRKCDADQQQQIVTANDIATTYASAASDYLLSHDGPTARYSTWFGDFDAAKYGTVTVNFNYIANTFGTQEMSYNCGCKKNTYGYVRPDRPYEIYLCRAFWSAPLGGTDSKAGTLVALISRFSVVAGTEEWAFGKSAAMSLAVSDPAKAIDNADSYQYFAENTPSLP